MNTYSDLKLKELLEKCDIDFAHYTYKKGQCSCCYGPKDLAKTHWRKGIEVTEDLKDYSYILFKNADNGGGYVKKTDHLHDIEFISWRLDNNQLDRVCYELSVQYGDGWVVLVPKDSMTTIIVMNRKYAHFDHYFYRDKHGFEIFYENGNKFKKDK